MARRAASWSARVSPMPTRMPVVKGMASSPAKSRVARRRAGTLSGAPRWASRSSASDSSIMPWLAATGRSVASSPASSAPGVGVGEEAGLLQDEAAHGGEVVHRRGVALRGQPLRRHGVAQLGPLAQGEEGLVAPGRLPASAMASTSSGRRYGAVTRAGALAKVQ